MCEALICDALGCGLMVFGISFAYDADGSYQQQKAVEVLVDTDERPLSENTPLNRKISRLEDCGCGCDLGADALADAAYLTKHTYQCDKIDLMYDALNWREQFGGETGKSLPRFASLCGRLPFLMYRMMMAIFTSVILGWTVWDAAMGGRIEWWSIYYANWVSLLSWTYFSTAMVLSAFAVITAGTQSKQNGPKLVWACWALYGCLGRSKLSRRACGLASRIVAALWPQLKPTSHTSGVRFCLLTSPIAAST